MLNFLKMIGNFKVYFILGGILISIFGGLVNYTLDLRQENALLGGVVQLLSDEIVISEMEKARLRQDLEDLDRLYREKTDRYAAIEAGTSSAMFSLLELGKINEEVNVYLVTDVPDPVSNRLRNWN